MIWTLHADSLIAGHQQVRILSQTVRVPIQLAMNDRDTNLVGGLDHMLLAEGDSGSGSAFSRTGESVGI
jgi:hypothetical protein